MGIVSALKGAVKYVTKPLAKIKPSKAAFKGFGSKLKNIGTKLKPTKLKSIFTKAGLGTAAAKVGSIFGSKAGKVGLAVAGGAALIGGSIFLYNKLTGSDEPDKTQPNVIPDDELPEEDDGKVPPKKDDDGKVPPNKVPDDKDGKVPPNKVPDDKDDKVPPNKIPDDKDDKVPPNKIPDDEVKPDDKVEPKEAKEYTVVKGDNVWNIAKAHLKEMHKDDPNYKPSNAEIAVHTKELMAANKLHYEADNYHVMIRPGDKLKLVA